MARESNASPFKATLVVLRSVGDPSATWIHLSLARLCFKGRNSGLSRQKPLALDISDIPNQKCRESAREDAVMPREDVRRRSGDDEREVRRLRHARSQFHSCKEQCAREVDSTWLTPERRKQWFTRGLTWWDPGITRRADRVVWRCVVPSTRLAHLSPVDNRLLFNRCHCQFRTWQCGIWPPVKLVGQEFPGNA